MSNLPFKIFFFFTMSEVTRTRRHAMKLKGGKIKTDERKYRFTQHSFDP